MEGVLLRNHSRKVEAALAQTLEDTITFNSWRYGDTSLSSHHLLALHEERGKHQGEGRNLGFPTSQSPVAAISALERCPWTAISAGWGGVGVGGQSRKLHCKASV